MKNQRFVAFSLVGLVLSVIIFMGVPSMSSASPADTLTIAMGNFGEETFLPWNGSGPRYCYLTPIYEFLVYLDPESGKLLPGLATKWEVSADGKTWTFWLRQGVQFHEGWGEFTADDVVYTVKRIVSPESRSGPGGQLRGWLDTIEAPERYKIVFRLKIPLADLPTTFLVNNMQFAMVCKKYIETVGDEKANTHPIGTGPYTLVEHKRGISVKLQAIDNVEKHWRIKPQFKNINFLIVPEEATRVAMLKKGEVDLTPISYDSVAAIKTQGLNIISLPRSWAPAIRLGGLVTTDPKRYKPNNPWADKRVRQSLNYAVDKEAIVRSIFRGEAVATGVAQILPEWFDIKPYPYDAVKAKQLLADAGFSNGFNITLKTCTQTPGAELPILGQAVAMYWQQIGLDVKIVPIDYGTLRSEWTGGKALDYAWTLRGLPFNSPATGISIEHTSKAGNASFVTEKTESMINEIMKELDIKRRTAIVKEMGEYLHDEACAVFLTFANEPYGTSKKVGKWTTPPMMPINMEYITSMK